MDATTRTVDGRTVMLITNVTTVGFKMPDEYEAEQNFRLSNDMRAWEKHEDSQYVYYIKTDHSTMTVKRKGEQP